MIPLFLALDVGSKICQAQLCSSIRGCHATFFLKNTLFKEEVAWQPLREQQSCSPSMLDPWIRAFKCGIVYFLPSFLVKILVVISKNVHFYLIKSTFLDITTYIFTRTNGRKTNNTSFECPNMWPQHTRRTALPLSQGLPCNLLFKKCIF